MFVRRHASLGLELRRRPQKRRLAYRTTPHEHETTKHDMTPQEMASLQTNLLREASYLTRTLYRKCLKSVKLLAEGNARDEDDFAERESKELGQFNDGASGTLERISMAPPVNRQNELASRRNYYQSHARENFDGHWNLLGAHGFHIGEEGNMSHGLGGLAKQQLPYYVWREDQIEQFLFLIKSGEEKRLWILKDYQFEDPFHATSWSQELEDRLQSFETQSNALVRAMYRREGWSHSSDYENHADSEDDFFDDSDSDEEECR